MFKRQCATKTKEVKLESLVEAVFECEELARAELALE